MQLIFHFLLFYDLDKWMNPGIKLISELMPYASFVNQKLWNGKLKWITIKQLSVVIITALFFFLFMTQFF